MSNPTIIGTSSFAQSGGSALTNILEEFSAFSVVRGGQHLSANFLRKIFLPWKRL